MAEYLAPGVYVEEVDTGPRPIEGVSTSTAGVVGVAERGPVNRPILITSGLYGNPGDYPGSAFRRYHHRGTAGKGEESDEADVLQCLVHGFGLFVGILVAWILLLNKF